MSDIGNSFEKHKGLVMLITILLIAADIYYLTFDWFITNNYTHEYINRVMVIIIKTGVLKNLFTVKVIIIILSVLFNVLQKGKKNLEHSKRYVAVFMSIATLNFLFSGYLTKLVPHGLIYSLYMGLSLLYLVKSYSFFTRLLNTDIMKDRYNKKNKIFPQTTHIIENDLSVNIPYKFIEKYKGEKPIYKTGYINMVAPQRATMILGKPGSGKSYSFVEEIIRQHIMKGFAMINYDYKFPTLTELSYNYYQTYKNNYNKYSNGGRFATINIDDPRYSDRCNPISAQLLESKAQAIDAVYTLFFNIDKKSAQKQDFFQMSAMAITSASLWFLKMYKNGRYCSLPHLINFINQSDEAILTILDNYKELQYFTSSFSDALRKQSFDQLSGQTASARVPLGKLVTDEMFWVMAPPEGAPQIDLRINKEENVTILNIANNPDTQKSNAPALGLFLSQSAKLINAQNRVPCDFLIDEFPTIYVNGVNNLIATGRSNKVCTTLSIQDYSQIVNEYGKEQADTVFNTVDNIISGKVANDTAEKISKTIGKFNYQTQSISIQKDSTSTSYNTQREWIVPSEDIAQFAQGEFVGILSDTFKDPLDLKVFRGIVSPSKHDLTDKTLPFKHPDLTKDDLRDYAKQIEDDITEIITEELGRIQDEKRVENARTEEIQESNNDVPPIPMEDNGVVVEEQDSDQYVGPQEDFDEIEKVKVETNQEVEEPNDKKDNKPRNDINQIKNTIHAAMNPSINGDDNSPEHAVDINNDPNDFDFVKKRQ